MILYIMYMHSFGLYMSCLSSGHEKHITRMLERKAQGGKKGMLDLTYKQGPAADKFGEGIFLY